MNNSGLILKRPDVKDFVFGSFSPIRGAEINPSSDWRQFKIADERQKFRSLETMACVSYSALNCIEMVLKAKTGNEVNFSDRALAKMSNTTKNGNWLFKVAETARKQGICEEKYWPYPSSDAQYTWDDYYKEVTQGVLSNCSSFLEGQNISHEWVNISKVDLIVQALKQAPIQVIVKAWYKDGDVYISPKDASHNHAVTYLYTDVQRKRHIILDHYEPFIKELAWDYEFDEWALLFGVHDKVPVEKDYNIKDDYLYWLSDGLGGYGLGLNNKIYIDSKADVLGTWHARNNGYTADKIVHVKTPFWNQVPKLNFKGEVQDKKATSW